MRRKEVLTTGEVARICRVAPRTVSKWFDSGQLRGYRIPGSRDRRIPLAQLVEFMKAHGMPLTELDGNVTRVLLAVPGDSEVAAVAEQLSQMREYELKTAANDFEAGMRAGDFQPHVILVDILADAVHATEILKNIRSNASLVTTRIVAVAGPLTNGQQRALLRKGFDAVLPEPYELEDLVAAIEAVTDMLS